MFNQLKRKFCALYEPVDSTQGKAWKAIIRFALPIFIFYLLQQFYIIAETAICGQIHSAEEVAGVNDTFAVSSIFLQFAFGSTAGFSAVFSKKIGKNDLAGARKSFAAQLILNAATCAVTTIIAIFTISPLLSLVGLTPDGGVSNAEVYRAAQTYMLIIAIGLAAMFFYNFIGCILRAMGDSVTPLIFLLVSALLNIGLDLLFIIVLDLGVAGAAWATVIAQSISTVGCFIYTFYRYKELRLHREDFSFSSEFIFEHLKSGIPLGLQFSLLAFGIVAYSNVIIAFDKTAEGVLIAGMPAENACGAASKVVLLMMSPLTALGTAMLSFSKQNAAEENRDRLRSGIKQAFLIMLIIYVTVLSIGLALTVNGAYMYLFLSADKVTPEAIVYGNTLIYAELPCFLLLGTLFISRSVLHGLGKWLFPSISGVIELIARNVICMLIPQAVAGGAITCQAPVSSFLALCFTDPGAWLCAAVAMFAAMFYYVNRRPKKACMALDCSTLENSSVENDLTDRTA
ncbi:MAG: MATE family efflux transporter [Candidatus Coproplasma sp.]